MNGWQLVYTRQAQKDAKLLNASGLRQKAQELLNLLSIDPFKKPSPYEKLVGDLAGAYSRRINVQHRLVYQVIEDRRIVKILRMWTHYEQELVDRSAEFRVLKLSGFCFGAMRSYDSVFVASAS